MLLPLVFVLILLCTDFGQTESSVEAKDDDSGPQVDALGGINVPNGLLIQPRNRHIQVTSFPTSTLFSTTSASLVLGPLVTASQASPSSILFTTSSTKMSSIANIPSSQLQKTIASATTFSKSSISSPTPRSFVSVAPIKLAAPASISISAEDISSSSSRKPPKIPVSGIGFPPSTMRGFQTLDPAQYGIGPPPAGFKAPKKKSEPDRNIDIDSAPF